MSELIMTISDDEDEQQPQISTRKRTQPATADAAEAVEDESSGGESESESDESAGEGEGSAEDSEDDDADDDGDDDDEEDEQASFGGSFHFEASDSDSDEEVVHAWDLSDARAAAVQGGKGTNLRAKIDATLRRKGPSTEVAPEEDAAEAEAQAADDAAAIEPVSAKARKKQQAKALKALATSARRGGGSSSSSSGGGGGGGEDEDEDAVLTAKPNVQHSGKGWNELALSRPLLRAVKDLGFANPTPIQAEAIPFALQGRDICGAAVTGSGKTAAFILPVLERLIYRPRRVAATRVLVITPTRELAVQIHAMTNGLGRHTDVRVAMAVGGLSLQTQETALRTRPDVVVATPGRMIDLIRNSNSISMDELEILILDEADRLLDLGFQDEVEELVKLCPRGRQVRPSLAIDFSSVSLVLGLS
jgi:ATP-dependent RNA helicase DDX27